MNGGSICIGYPYSLLDWVPEAHSSWSLSVSVKRIPSNMTTGEMGIAQIKDCKHARILRAPQAASRDGRWGLQRRGDRVTTDKRDVPLEIISKVSEVEAA